MSPTGGVRVLTQRRRDCHSGSRSRSMSRSRSKSGNRSRNGIRSCRRRSNTSVEAVLVAGGSRGIGAGVLGEAAAVCVGVGIRMTQATAATDVGDGDDGADGEEYEKHGTAMTATRANVTTKTARQDTKATTIVRTAAIARAPTRRRLPQTPTTTPTCFVVAWSARPPG